MIEVQRRHHHHHHHHLMIGVLCVIVCIIVHIRPSGRRIRRIPFRCRHTKLPSFLSMIIISRSIFSTSSIGFFGVVEEYEVLIGSNA